MSHEFTNDASYADVSSKRKPSFNQRSRLVHDESNFSLIALNKALKSPAVPKKAETTNSQKQQNNSNFPATPLPPSEEEMLIEEYQQSNNLRNHNNNQIDQPKKQNKWDKRINTYHPHDSPFYYQ